MAEILIRNIYVPSEGYIPLRLYCNGTIMSFSGDLMGKLNSVVLPEHGRLISADDVSKNIIASVCQFCSNAMTNNCKGCKVEDCLQAW